MKIFFLGYHNPHFITVTEYMEKAIKSCGIELVSFDDRAYILPGRVRQKIKLLQDWDLRRMNKSLLSLVLNHKPDLFLATGGVRILPEILKKIKAAGIKTILWTIDPPHDLPYDSISLNGSFFYYDHIFCGGTEMLEYLQSKKFTDIHWLPFACDPGYHHPVSLTAEEKQKYAHDIVFVGSFYPNRQEILEKLVDFDLAVWGPGWNKISAGSPLRNHIRGGKLDPEEWAKIYSAAKIALVIHYHDGINLCYQASPKVYEILACGVFLVSDAQRDVLSLFKNKQELLTFSNITELREILKYYLDHSKEREIIAGHGREKVLGEHTYLNRVRGMIAIIADKDKWK